jgi:outer membrane protein
MSRSIARVFLASTLAALALSPITGRAQDAAATPPLTLEQCIALVMKKNFDIQVQALSTESAKLNLIIAQASFDPTLTASINRNFSQAASATSRLDGTSTSGPSSDNNTTRFGVNQLLPQTGGTVGLSTNLSRSASNSSNNLLNPSFGDSVSLSVSQPLLKNFGPTVTKANVETNKIGLSIAVLAYRSRVLTVISQTENAYYNLVSARETLRIRQLSLDLAQKLFDENTTRHTTGVMTDLEVLTAEVGVANARRAVIQADQGVSNAEDSLLTLINTDNFDTRPGAVIFPDYNEAAPAFATSYKLVRENYPDTLSTEDQIKQLEISLAVAKKNQLPQLDLSASLGYTGKATNEGYSSLVSDLPHNHGNNWSLGLNYSMPWGRHADKARYRSAAINLNSQKIRLDQLEQTLLVNVRSAVRSVETNLVSVEIAAKATELSVKTYEQQKARFDNGLSTSRLVLQAQDDLENARFNELTAKLALRSALAELHRLEGTSLRRFNVQIPGE